MFGGGHAALRVVGAPPGWFGAMTKMRYFEKEDVLHLTISDEPEGSSIELSPNITVECNDKGELIGIEILNASEFIRDSFAESAQAKALSLFKF